jgi:hypothetical protein
MMPLQIIGLPRNGVGRRNVTRKNGNDNAKRTHGVVVVLVLLVVKKGVVAVRNPSLRAVIVMTTKIVQVIKYKTPVWTENLTSNYPKI